MRFKHNTQLSSEKIILPPVLPQVSNMLKHRLELQSLAHQARTFQHESQVTNMWCQSDVMEMSVWYVTDDMYSSEQRFAEMLKCHMLSVSQAAGLMITLHAQQLLQTHAMKGCNQYNNTNIAYIIRINTHVVLINKCFYLPSEYKYKSLYNNILFVSHSLQLN